MQVKLDDLARHLQGELQPVYLVSGDDTLLVEESCDAIIAAARAQGFTERSVHYAQGSFKWHELSHDSASLSLFAERKILDVRVPGAKFDREASDAIKAWLAGAGQADDSMLLIRTARLEPRQRSAAWFKAIDQAGAICLIWPMAPNQLPRWLGQRLRSAGLQAAPDALQYLADRVEGNLLAAVQEIYKLSLLDIPAPISVEAMVAALDDASRFNAFDLLDAMMAGQAPRVSHILAVLREEGVAIFAILGALTSQLRRMQGSTGRLPPARQKLLDQFSARVRDPSAVLAECALIDMMVKGQRVGEPWIALERLLLRLSGTKGMRPMGAELKDLALSS